MAVMAKHIEKSYFIHAPIAKVWEALINPKIIKQYFFGTEAVSDWKTGSTIHYTGEWQGEKYHDKGIIENMIPEKELTISHWSDRTGLPDKPEYYSMHSYELSSIDENTTQIIIYQEDKFKTEESRSKAWKHWDIVMTELKKVLEP